MASEKQSNIAFVLDERLSREKAGILNRIVAALRQVATVQVLPGTITEAELLGKLETEPFQLVLAPWYRYFSWSKVEAFFGLTRTSGPTFAGYFAEPVSHTELTQQADHLRAILLDFAHLSPAEATMLVRALLTDSRRCGIRALQQPGTPVYCENWYSGQGVGSRIDSIFSIPEVIQNEWHLKRPNALRTAICALWSLVFDEGPGKIDTAHAPSSGPKAYFQISADASFLSLRLFYMLPGQSPKSALERFWPDQDKPASPARLLSRYADFFRVHAIAASPDIEVVVGLCTSAPAEQAPDKAHTVWIEPVAAKLVTEPAYEAPNPNSPHLKSLPSTANADAKPRVEEDEKSKGVPAQKDRFIFEAAKKIRELKQVISEREEVIRELRSGGIGTAQPLAPPDVEELLEAFQERYFEARFQIRQFEIQLATMERQGAQPAEIETLRQKIAALTVREEDWIKKILATLEVHRQEKQKRKLDRK